jgi:hypothetical protein
MAPPSARPLTYIDKNSPADAGLWAEANCPVVACQMAPLLFLRWLWRPPAGGGFNRGGRQSLSQFYL